MADKYIGMLNEHFIYKNDETSLANYCASITVYPWLINGTLSIGSNSTPPTNLKSFCGSFINMIHCVKHAEWCLRHSRVLMYLDYFIRQEYGNDYFAAELEVADLPA